jgi:hypothetical protein
MLDTKQGNSLVKSPYQIEKFSSDEFLELERCADPLNGPLYFMQTYFYIQHATRGRLLFDPFPFQVELVNAYHNNRFCVALLSRQTGKTTCAAGYVLWYAMFVPDSTILIAAHKFTGAQEIMSRIRFGYENVPNHIRAGATSYNKGSLEFDNGSRIISATTTGTTGRGMSISLLYSDEFAFVQPRMAKEFWTSISPTLSTGGKCIITSTPNSDEDQFSEIWGEANKRLDEYGNPTTLGKNGFFPFKADWRQHPERTEEWAAAEKSRIGLEKFRREHDLEFIIASETLIDPQKLATLRSRDPTHRIGQVRWYKQIEKDKTYLLALDPSLGTGGDQAAIEVFELPGMQQVAEWQNNKTPIEQQVNILRQLTLQIKEVVKADEKIYYTVENNTLGEAALVVIRDVGEENFAGIFLSDHAKSRKGFNTTHKEKISACARVKNLVENDRIRIFSSSLISELKSFEAKGTSFAAKWGETDDLVSALLLIVRMTRIVSAWDQTLYDDMKNRLSETDMPLPFVMSRF